MAGQFLYLGLTTFKRRLVHIANRGDTGVGQLRIFGQVIAAAPAESNDCDVHLVIGAAQGRCRSQRRGGGG
jgi:hypothetical protein